MECDGIHTWTARSVPLSMFTSLRVQLGCSFGTITSFHLYHGGDIWDEEEKEKAYTFTDSGDLQPPTPYMHGMGGTGLWWCCKLYTAGKWIAAQLNVMAVIGFVPMFPGSPPTQRFNQLSYLPTPTYMYRYACSYASCVYVWEFMQVWVYVCIDVRQRLLLCVHVTIALH